MRSSKVVSDRGWTLTGSSLWHNATNKRKRSLEEIRRIFGKGKTRVSVRARTRDFKWRGLASVVSIVALFALSTVLALSVLPNSNAQQGLKINIAALYLGDSSQASALVSALKTNSQSFVQSTNPTLLPAISQGTVVYLDKAWYQGLSSSKAVDGYLKSLLVRGIPVIEVLPQVSNTEPFLTTLVSGVNLQVMGTRIDGTAVQTTLVGYGLKVYPSSGGKISSSQGSFVASSKNLAADAGWFAAYSLTWAQSASSNINLPQGSASVPRQECAKSNSISVPVAHKMEGRAKPECPTSGASNGSGNNLYGSWDRCGSGNEGIITANDNVYPVTNTGSGTTNVYDFYMFTSVVPGVVSSPSGCGSTWYGAYVQEHIDAGVNSGIYIDCYGPGTTPSQSSVTVDAGIGTGGINLGFSYTYTLNSASITDTSSISQSTNLNNWKTNLQKDGVTGDSTFNSEPGVTFSEAKTLSHNLKDVWQEAQWVKPGYCVFGGWSCGNAYLSETYSSWFQEYFSNPSW